MPPTDQELLTKLIHSTINEKVNWQATATSEQYAAAFGGKWTVTVDKSIEPNAGIYWLSISNAEGKEILTIFNADDARVAELFEMARRKALKVDEAIADLLKELD